jgi:hypothetical protein
MKAGLVARAAARHHAHAARLAGLMRQDHARVVGVELHEVGMRAHEAAHGLVHDVVGVVEEALHHFTV